MDRNIGWLLKIFLKYLRRTKELFLVNGEGDLQVSRYTDTSFQSDKDDYKSQSGFVCFIMSGWAFVWKSSKQDIIKAEYIVNSNGSGLDQRSSLDELGVVSSIVDLIPIYWDNNGAIAQAMEPRSHQGIQTCSQTSIIWSWRSSVDIKWR